MATREELVRRLHQASAKVDEWRAVARERERVFLKRKTPSAMHKAEREWMAAERQAMGWERKARELMEEVARIDRRKRKKRPPGRYRYHPRVSSNSKRGKFNRVEVFFQRRDGARMTEIEVLQALSDLAAGGRRRDLVVGSVRWGKRGNKRSTQTRAVLSDFAAMIASGQLDSIGEERIG